MTLLQDHWNIWKRYFLGAVGGRTDAQMTCLQQFTVSEGLHFIVFSFLFLERASHFSNVSINTIGPSFSLDLEKLLRNIQKNKDKQEQRLNPYRNQNTSTSEFPETFDDMEAHKVYL